MVLWMGSPAFEGLVDMQWIQNDIGVFIHGNIMTRSLLIRCVPF